MKKILSIGIFLCLATLLNAKESGRAGHIEQEMRVATAIWQLNQAASRIPTVASGNRKTRLYKLFEERKAILMGKTSEMEQLQHQEWMSIYSDFERRCADFKQEFDVDFALAEPVGMQMQRTQNSMIMDQSIPLSLGKIMGGKSGRVWRTVVTMKKKLKTTKKNSKASLEIIRTVMNDTTKYTRAERLNIACELAVNPEFRSLQMPLVGMMMALPCSCDDMTVAVFALQNGYDELVPLM